MCQSDLIDCTVTAQPQHYGGRFLYKVRTQVQEWTRIEGYLTIDDTLSMLEHTGAARQCYNNLTNLIHCMQVVEVAWKCYLMHGQIEYSVQLK